MIKIEDIIEECDGGVHIKKILKLSRAEREEYIKCLMEQGVSEKLAKFIVAPSYTRFRPR